MNIKDIIEQYKITPTEYKAIKSERTEILNKIIERLEADRKLAGYKPLGAGTYVIKMAQAGIKSVQDLYWFDGYLNDSKTYSATWWWYIKDKRVKK